MKCLLVGHPGSQHIVPASKYLTSKYLPWDVSYWNHTGPKEEWSTFLWGVLQDVDDEYVVLGLDDYLVSAPPVNPPTSVPDGYECVKLCHSTEQEHEEYPVTTQYTLWRRDTLAGILEHTTSAWDFELTGSQDFNVMGLKSLQMPCMAYDTSSCLSPSWEGVRVRGLSPEDEAEVKKLCGIL